MPPIAAGTPYRNHRPRKKPRRSDPTSSPPSLSDGRLPQKAFQSQSLNRTKTPYPGSVEHFWRYAQVADGANRRLIDALANAPLKGEATQELDELCRSRNRDGTRVPRFNPVDADTVLLFIAVLSSPSPASATATSRPSCSTPRPRMNGRPDAEPTRPPA